MTARRAAVAAIALVGACGTSRPAALPGGDAAANDAGDDATNGGAIDASTDVAIDAAADVAIDAPMPDVASLQTVTLPHPSNRDVDILFVVDDAPGAREAQEKLVAAFPTFAATLAARPGGLPRLHLGVISSDLGAGPSADSGCAPGGDRGVLRGGALAACAALATGPRFVSNVDDEAADAGAGASHDGGDGAPGDDASVALLTGAFPCLARLGDAGCGFRHPLAAALRALGADGAPAPAENAGFLRPGAFLSIVVLATGDDCSATADSDLFDATSRYISDPLGPLTPFRCAEFGLSCGGAPPPRTRAGPVAGCQSAEDGRLLRVGDVVAKLEALKADPNTILIGALSGPPTPFDVVLSPPGLPADPSPWPAVAPSCATADGGTAAGPGVRLEQWVYAFGHNGVVENVCGDDFTQALADVASGIGDVLGPACLTARIARTDGPHGARPDCTITDHAPASDGTVVDTPLPSCLDDGGVAPCWTLAPDPACVTGALLSFEAPPGAPAVGLDASVECRVCADAADPRCP
jgi:hypothetical protein